MFNNERKYGTLIKTKNDAKNLLNFLKAVEEFKGNVDLLLESYVIYWDIQGLASLVACFRNHVKKELHRRKRLTVNQ